MSPFLFSFFLADIEMHLQENINDGIDLEQLQLYLLLFADDAVLFSETREGLQRNIDNLEKYCQKWNLTVNVEKTKIVVFRNGGILAMEDRWYFAGQEIEIVNHILGSFLQVGVHLCKTLKH